MNYPDKSGNTSELDKTSKNLDLKLLSLNRKPALATLLIISQNGLQTISKDMFDNEELI